jgi:hypothetical protein
MFMNIGTFACSFTFEKTNPTSHLVVPKDIDEKTFAASKRTYFIVLLNASFF